MATSRANKQMPSTTFTEFDRMAGRLDDHEGDLFTDCVSPRQSLMTRNSGVSVRIATRLSSCRAFRNFVSASSSSRLKCRAA